MRRKVVVAVMAVAAAALMWTVGPSAIVGFLLRTPIILASLFRPASRPIASSPLQIPVLESPATARILVLSSSQNSGTVAVKLSEPVATTASQSVLNPPSRNLLTPEDILPPGTAPTPSVTAPDLSVPTVSTPIVSVPDVTVPGVSTPTVSVPGVTVPSVSTPTVTVPGVSVPSVSTPSAPAPSAPGPSGPGTTPGGGGVTIGPVKLP
jgi:hypothetical protein